MQLKIEADVNRARSLLSNSSPPSWLVPFDRNPSYVDRQVLEQAKAGLFGKGSMSNAAIYGLGGVGKTQVALELAYQIREDHPDCSVFWIPAMSANSIQEAYLKIADHLGIMIASQEREEVARAVCNYFGQTASGRWFLIFDNADDVEFWNHALLDSSTRFNFRDSLPSSPRGRILFTTRSIKVAQTLASQNVFHIPELDQNGATRVLRNLLINKDLLDDQENTRELLQRLTYLPLAIAQAAAFINQNTTDIAGYISLLDGQELDAIKLLSEDFEDKGRYKSIKNPVATTWLTSFDQIRKLDPLAARYLSFMACLNSRDIPISLLPSSSPVERERAIGSLRAYSLVRLRPDSHRLDLHRLVHLAMRNSLRSTGALHDWEEHALREICSKFPPGDAQYRDIWREYLPHAFTILATVTTGKLAERRAFLQWQVSMVLFLDGRHQEGIALIRKAIKYREEAFGPEDRATLDALHGLVLLYQYQGRTDKARELDTQILQTRLRVFGPDSPDVGKSLSSLAATHNCLGNHKVAEWLGISAIKSRLRHCGVDSIDTRAAISALVNAYYGQGRLTNAAELATQLHSLTVKACGPEGQETLMTENTLAAIYAQQGRWEDAETLCATTLSKYRKLLGPHHPATLDCMRWLALILGEQGRDTEAAILAIEEARELERVHGPDHESVQNAYKQAEHLRHSKFVALSYCSWFVVA